MATFKNDTLATSFPAYDIFARKPHTHTERTHDAVNGWTVINHEDVTELTDGEELHCEGKYGTFTIGSVVGYALQYNECPIKAAKNAERQGHKLQWINANCSVISNTPSAKRKLIQVRIGMKVRFQGVISTIEKAPNDNLKLVPVEA